MLLCSPAWSVPAAAQPGGAAPPQAAVRVGLTPVFLDEQIALVKLWRTYLEARLGRPVEFVRRASYREIVDLLQQKKLEFAWLCGYPYVVNRGSLDLVVVPIYKGRPLYQSYLIVPSRDLATAGLADLKSRIFAYSDPNSNSGFLVVQDQLRELGEDQAFFFRKSFFTGAHRKVVEAVGAGLADGGAVDGYVYDALAQLQPALVARTRVVVRSRDYGFPPIVARKGVPRADYEAMQRALLAMNADGGGAAVLRELHLDGFGKAQPALFEDIRRMAVQQRRPGDAS